jgi:nicotinamide-nucleotide amidase
MTGCIETDLSSRAQPIVDALRSSGRSVVTAESCTGGLIAAVLSHAEAASECLHGGFVVYTKAQKHAALGVDDRLMQLQGAVNGEVARQMAEGALHRSPATIAVSVTGVLGPNTDEDGNPPGLIYLGLAEAGKPTLTVRHEFGDAEPDFIRKETVSRALEMLLRAAQTRT